MTGFGQMGHKYDICLIIYNKHNGMYYDTCYYNELDNKHMDYTNNKRCSCLRNFLTSVISIYAYKKYKESTDSVRSMIEDCRSYFRWIIIKNNFARFAEEFSNIKLDDPKNIDEYIKNVLYVDYI